MKFNICVIKPINYIHSEAFIELAELIKYSLQDLGHEAEINVNQTFLDARNILIGIHLLDPKHIKQTPKTSIILNTEQIYSDTTTWNKNIFEWVKNFETWDYSERNILKLRELGVENPKHLRIGFHPKLARLKKATVQDIDVLFYGSMSDRRQKIIDALVATGMNVKAVFGVYSGERDELISRAKVVLNLHNYDSQIFEIVRVFYLVTNRKAVVCEVGANTSIDSCYATAIYASPYDDLVTSCKKLVADDHLRAELETAALETIRKMPQHSLIAPLI